MSFGLVKVLALGAGALITAGAVERGWRHGSNYGNDKLGEFDTNLLMRGTKQTSDDFVIDGIGDKLKSSMQFDTGIMGSIYRGWYGITGALGEVVKSIVPLGIAGISFLAGGPIGAIGLGALGLMYGGQILTSSGLVKNNSSDILDIKVT